MAYDGSLKFDTKIDKKGFEKGVNGLKSTANSAMKVVNGLMKTGAVAVAGIGIASIKVGSEFKSGMSQVAATMGITVDEINSGSKSFELLEKAAKDMGATTMFSATESAEALNYLALAGYDAEDSVSMLPKVLNLAGAGGLDLAYASDMVTDSMGALGLEIDQADSYIDQLAKTSQKSNTDVGQLGEAILTVGANGADLKNGTVELTTAIGLLGNSGIKGAEAGTKLRNIIMAMTPTTDKAINAFKTLEVETHDVNGEMRGLDEVFGDLNASMEGMTSEEKKGWLNDIFNKQDMAAALTLLGATASSTDDLGFALEELGIPIDQTGLSMDELIATTQDFGTAQEFSAMAMEDWGLTAEQSELAYELLKGGLEDTSAWQELANEIENSEGAAQDLNDTLNDNLKGDLELFKSALSGVGIEIYESMDKPLRDVVQTFTGYIDEIGDTLTKNDELIESMEKMGLTIDESGRSINQIPTGFEGMAQVVGEILADIIVKIADFAPQAMDAAVTLATSFIGGIRESLPEISAAAVEVVTSFITGYMEIASEIMVLGIELITNIIGGMAEAMPELMTTALDVVVTIVDALMVNLPLILDAGMQIIMVLVEGITQNIEETTDVAMEIISRIADFLIQNLPLIIEAGVQLLVALIEGISSNTSELITTIIDIVIMLADTIIDNLPEIIEAGLELLVALIKGIMDNLPKLIAEVPRIINSFADAIYGMMPTILKTGVGIILELIKGLIKSIPTLVANIPQIIMAIVNVFTLYNWWNIGSNLINKIRTGIEGMGPKLIQAVMNLGRNIVTGITNIFTQAPSIGSGFVKGIMSGISSLASSLLSLGKTMATNALSAIKTAFSQAPSLGSDMVKGIWNGISNVQGWILSKIKGFGSSIISGVKDIFKIKSPSQIMRDEVGMMIAEGVAVGIDKGAPIASKAAKDMGNAVLKISKDVNKEMKNETYSNNKEIAKIQKRANEDIYIIEKKARDAKRKLTKQEKIKIRRLKEDSDKKIIELQLKANAEKLKLEDESNKELLRRSESFINERYKQGKMSLTQEVYFWDQLSKLVDKKSDEYIAALDNRQKAVSKINDELIKINAEYTDEMKRIDQDLVDNTRKVNEEYEKAYENRVNSLVNVGGLFEEFVAKDRISGEQLLDNMESQIVALAQYEGYIANLGKRIGNADLMGELKTLGPKAVGEIESLVMLSDEQLADYVSMYEARFSMATRQAEKELEPMKENTEKQIKELNEMANSRLEKLNNDWSLAIKKLVGETDKELETLNEVGKNAIIGLEDGMLAMEPQLVNTAHRIASNIASIMASALQINSPSKLIENMIGKNIMLGLGVGMDKEMPTLERNIDKNMAALADRMSMSVSAEKQFARARVGGSVNTGSTTESVTNNNDNGITQNVTIVSPEGTPSENARQLKKVGRELAFGY